jgi:hypothetical protein
MNHARVSREAASGRFLALRLVSVISLAVCCHPRSCAAAEKTEDEPPGGIAVALKEIPAWEMEAGPARSIFLYGNPARIQEQKQEGCTYPDFQSTAPLYGQILHQNASRNTGHLALDHSEGQTGTYDLLYFDENGDRDLTNDPPRRARKDLPDVLAEKAPYLREQVWFESVKLSFDFGPAGQRPVEVMPHLSISEGGPKRLCFVPPTVRTGTFRIGDQTYRAFLGYRVLITGRLDEPGTGLVLAPEGGAPAMWVGADELKAIHWLAERYYRFSCTPTGDQLFVRPYDGPLGVFEVVAGGRNVKKVTMNGSLYSGQTAVAIADFAGTGWPEPTRRCEIPVGDYFPASLHVSFDNIRVGVAGYRLSAERLPGGRTNGANIAIRADKPYVLDFASEPVVVFTWPKDTQIRAGEQVWIRAVLADPTLGIMIRGLDDMAGGHPDSLAPWICIKRADGQVVAHGVMPFG